MQTFIVLGLIPGTNIQINFFTSLIILGALFVSIVYYLIKHITLINKFRKQLLIRRPLHASQLHTRFQ